MLTKGVTIEKLKLCAASVGLLAWGQEDDCRDEGLYYGGLWLMFAACEPLRPKVEVMEKFASVAWSIQAKVEIC